jgi:O-6-methylguanine DNA methyltransferase
VSFYTVFIETPVGKIFALADEYFLYQLDFVKEEFSQDFFEKKYQTKIMRKDNAVLSLLQKELTQYFKGKLKVFTTSISFFGTPFQQKVWQGLQTIPYGKTLSYLELAKHIKNPTACRAVGSANGKNPISIIVPCHRVINHSGTMGGYGGGLERKKWLLMHEQQFF